MRQSQTGKLSTARILPRPLLESVESERSKSLLRQTETSEKTARIGAPRFAVATLAQPRYTPMGAASTALKAHGRRIYRTAARPRMRRGAKLVLAATLCAGTSRLRNATDQRVTSKNNVVGMA